MRHEASELHRCCVLNEKSRAEKDKEVEENDKEAGMLVIRNAIHCLKRGQSAEDCVCLNNVNHFWNQCCCEEQLQESIYGNCDLVVEETSQFIKTLFNNGVIRDIAVTVDKVTSGHVSYSVV